MHKRLATCKLQVVTNDLVFTNSFVVITLTCYTHLLYAYSHTKCCLALSMRVSHRSISQFKRLHQLFINVNLSG